MQKALTAVVCLLSVIGCGGLGSSNQKRFAVDEGMEFAPSWGQNLNKSRLFNAGARPSQRTDAKGLFSSASPVTGNASSVLLLCRISLPKINKLDGYDARVDPLLVFADPSGAVLRYPSEFNVEQVFLTVPLITLQAGTWRLKVYDQARVGGAEIVGSLVSEYTDSLPLIFKAEEKEVPGLEAECRGLDSTSISALFEKELAALQEKIPEVQGSLAQGEKTNGYNKDLFGLYHMTQQLAALSGWQDTRVKEQAASVEKVRQAWDEMLKNASPKEP